MLLRENQAWLILANTPSQSSFLPINPTGTVGETLQAVAQLRPKMLVLVADTARRQEGSGRRWRVTAGFEVCHGRNSGCFSGWTGDSWLGAGRWELQKNKQTERGRLFDGQVGEGTNPPTLQSPEKPAHGLVPCRHAIRNVHAVFALSVFFLCGIHQKQPLFSFSPQKH